MEMTLPSTMIACLALLVASVGLFAIFVPQNGAKWWAIATAVSGLVLAGLSLEGSWLGIGLLSLGEIGAGLLILSHGTQEARKAGKLYLSAIVPAILLTLAAFALAGLHPHATGGFADKIVVCLVLLAFALKLGLLPFAFWVPAVTSAAPIGTVILIISVVDIATFKELANLRGEAAWLFENAQPVWIAIALVSMLGGALMAYAQTNIRRILAFSTITDMGLLLLGVSIGTEMAMAGAMIGALSHAISKAVLFGTVGIAEHRTGQTLTLDTRGLVGLMPFTAAAFILAAINFIGVPPGMGFGAYWRIYLAAAEIGGISVIALLLMVACIDLLVYARMIHRTWLGECMVDGTVKVSGLASAMLVGLAVLVIAIGVYPGPLSKIATPHGTEQVTEQVASAMSTRVRKDTETATHQEGAQ